MSLPVDVAEPRGQGPRTKGLAFRSVILWYEQRYGAGSLAAAAREKQPWLEEVFALDEVALGVIPNRWYPAAVTVALAELACDGLSNEEFVELSTGSAEWIMRDTVRGLYKLLFDWIATPARFVKYSGRVWASFYDHAEFSLTPVGERCIEAQIRGWGGYHHLIFALTQNVIVMMFEEMGCEVQSRPAHVEQGVDGLNAFIVAWRGGKTVLADPLAEKEGSGIYEVQ